jgi:SAM-dependent methyltransferase
MSETGDGQSSCRRGTRPGDASKGGLGESPSADPADPAALWECHAAWWQREFTDGADPEYEEQILPLLAEELEGSRSVLDLGTGEGQLARRLRAAGASVVGLDVATAQLLAARARGGGVAYLRGDVGTLPFRAGSFDAVVACLVLEHVVALDPVLDEVARVLGAGGRAVLALNHPLLQAPGSGWIDDQILGEQYWRIGSYLGEDTSMEEVAKGVILPFVHRPLSAYVNGLARRGLAVTALHEPAPPPGFLALAPEYAAAASIPRLCVLRAERVAPLPPTAARPGAQASSSAATPSPEGGGSPVGAWHPADASSAPGVSPSGGRPRGAIPPR